MKLNGIELKYFFDYCWSVLDMSIENNEKIHIKFSYRDNQLIMRTSGSNGFSLDSLVCDIEQYEKIIDEIKVKFISKHQIKSSNICTQTDKSICKISTENITIEHDIYREEHLNKAKSQINKTSNRLINNDDKNTNPTLFEKMNNLYAIYRIFLRRCINKNDTFEIYPSYNNGYLSIKICNNSCNVFYNKIKCDEEQANIIIKKICEDFISNHNISLSEIKPVTNNPQYLEQMIRKGFKNHFYVAKDDKFRLFITFDINDPYYLNLNQRALEKMNPKIIKLFYNSKISTK